MKLCRRLVTLGPIGNLPAPGTMASVVTALVLYITQLRAWVGYLPLVVVISIAAVFLLRCALPTFYSHDPRPVVIDEVVGYMVGALFVDPFSLFGCVALLLFFRLFDITKIGGLKKLEYLPGVRGILLDDIGAGIYAGACTLAVIKIFERLPL